MYDTGRSTSTQTVFGRYRLIRLLAQGGMGVVYLAERADIALAKLYAIKFLGAAAHRPELISRFQAEWQNLAALNHPNIVSIADAGITDDGVPYMVMEYVEGLQIDVFAAARRLDEHEKLRTFLDVCAAVQHAHSHMVLHCDLKPANILVTHEGQVKLLDFGIARTISPQDSWSNSQNYEMTVEFASPEQLESEPLTVSTDVYSLGVVLHQLLTGRTPYRIESDAPGEIIQRICRDEPTVLVKGDLGHAIRKALAKQPRDRYSSVEQFAADLRNCEQRRPVSAHPKSLVYVPTLFMRRNQAATFLTIALLTALVAGIIGIWRQGQIAQRRFNDVRKLANTMVFEIHDSMRDLPGATATRRLLVKRALEYLDKLATEVGNDKSLQAELAAAYLRIGDVQGNPYEANIGDLAGARISYERSVELTPEKDRHHVYRRFAELLPVLGKPSEAVNFGRMSVRLYEAALKRNPSDTELRYGATQAYEVLGDTLGNPGLVNLGDREGARAAYGRAAELAEQAIRLDSSLRARRGSAILRVKMADLLSSAGDTGSASVKYSEAVEMLEKCAETNPNDSRTQRALASALAKRGMLRALADFPAAMADLRRSDEISRAQLNADPNNDQARMDVAVTARRIGDLLWDQKDRSGAIASYVEAVKELETLAKAAPDNRMKQFRYGSILVNLGQTFGEMGQPEQAARETRRGLAILKDVASQRGVTTTELAAYATFLLECEPSALRNPAEAVDYARRAVVAAGSGDASLLHLLARAEASNSRVVEAIASEEKALQLCGTARICGEIRATLAELRTR